MAEAAAVKILLQMITDLLTDEAYFLIGVEGKMKQLKSELEWMLVSIKEADEKRKSDEMLKLWVKQLREIAFDAEDVIDQFILIINHKKDSGVLNSLKNSITSTRRLPLLHKLAKRLIEINTKAEKLKANKDKYRVESAKTTGAEISDRVSSLTLQQKINLRRFTIATKTYEQDAVQIHGDTARRVIKSLLVGDGGDDDRRLRVISIVGMGGAGKTILSKRVYTDDSVQSHFDLRAFVYISKMYNLQDLLKNIMKCFASNSNEEKLSSEKLREYLQGSKYLIVLDDIWDRSTWDVLKNAFPDENNGSRVLLTTRHKHVALYADDSSSNSNIHELGIIDKFQSWELFLKQVFPSSTISDSQRLVYSINAEDLGKQMVEKCRRLPLAIAVLGSLLSSHEKKRSEWSKVNASVSWLLSQGDDSYKCSGILALSYDYLPFYLKPCFLYMSLLPEHGEIRVTKLFQYWIAEGFVSKREGEILEDTAENYLEELIRRSLIQVDKMRCDDERVKTCRIHGLLRDVSIAESKEDQFSQIYGSLDKFYEERNNSRRVAVYCKRGESIKYSRFGGSSPIRTLMCRRALFSESNYLSSLFGDFRSLRVLEFYSYSEGFVSFPKEVGELIHLRYLSLEKTKLERVNTSYLRKLVNLQTLNLNGCITELTLDNNIWRLQQLRHLYLDGIKPAASNSWCWWKSAADNIGIGNLTNLQLLIVQDGDWINGGELKKLSSLKKLRIEECLSSHSDEVSDAVANLLDLRSLALISRAAEGVPLASIQLSSHSFLRRLHFKGVLHGWTRPISFPPNLCKLKLECSLIQEDPMLILARELALLKMSTLGV
ncbi:hypothetical protein MKX03_001980 [Papaver bracteatum]|nr:hypothetical protein MKX03_001980 [Papaver bracteatum]